jgi:aquaporin Z
MKKYLAELIGTFILVLFGCGSAVVAGSRLQSVGIVSIALTFGFAMIGYWIGQFAGGILGAWVLSIIVSGAGPAAPFGKQLGRNGWGPGYLDEYSMTSAMLFEFIATLIFVIVILGATQKAAPAGFAGLAIGITLVAIHIFGIYITGVSVNPARSFGPALLVGGQAFAQVWLFLLFPSLGGAVAGILYRTKILEV